MFLVGAGPGDPGLITVRGAECLAQADLVLYDGLVNPLLLRLTRGVCERTARARRDDVVIVAQSDINIRLIREAQAGRTVVRLKAAIRIFLDVAVKKLRHCMQPEFHLKSFRG